jgi:hypothetical protein
LQGPEIFKLLIAVDEFNIQILVTCIQKHLINYYKDFLQKNFMEVLQMVYHNELFTDLLNYCLEEIEMIFDSDKITILEGPLLKFLLKRDDLNLDEIEIWDGLIKWGLTQEQGLTQDVSKWNKDNFNIFRGILCEFIPLVRFYGISSEDYINKVKPYDEILSKELREDILKFHLVPGYKPALDILPRRFIDFAIINRKHITLISNWIDNKRDNTKYNKISHKFNLLYRASRDGNSATEFHSKCDNKGATIVVAKIKNSEQIIGGYSPLHWDLIGGYKSTSKSFIFSFTDKSDLQTAKVAYSSGGQSIYCGPIHGPAFGNGLYVNYDNKPDVWCSDSTTSYPGLDLSKSMNVVDYEVLQVIKK